MDYMLTMFAVVFIGYPIWLYLQRETEDRLHRNDIHVRGQKKRKGPKPPPDKLPPLVGNVVERAVVKRILP